MSTNIAVSHRFNRAARHYDTHCRLQIQTGFRLIALLKSRYPSTERLMDIGCGTGLITQRLSSEFSVKTLHAIDHANELLRQARTRLGTAHVYLADFDQLSPLMLPFDVLFSNLALHWSTNFPALINRLYQLLNTPGYLAFSIPLSGSLNQLRPHFAVNHFITGEEVLAILNHCGYQVTDFTTEDITYQFNSSIEALRSIKRVGANFTFQPAHSSLRGKMHLRGIKLDHLTYRIGYFIAAKGTQTCL